MPVEIVVVAESAADARIVTGLCEREKARLRGSAKRLGFDPTKRAERLTARGNKGKRNAKSVLKELTGDDPERRDRCWQQTALAVLRERGIETGLAEFLDQIDFD